MEVSIYHEVNGCNIFKHIITLIFAFITKCSMILISLPRTDALRQSLLKTIINYYFILHIHNFLIRVALTESDPVTFLTLSNRGLFQSFPEGKTFPFSYIPK